MALSKGVHGMCSDVNSVEKETRKCSAGMTGKFWVAQINSKMQSMLNKYHNTRILESTMTLVGTGKVADSSESLSYITLADSDMLPLSSLVHPKYLRFDTGCVNIPELPGGKIDEALHTEGKSVSFSPSCLRFLLSGMCLPILDIKGHFREVNELCPGLLCHNCCVLYEARERAFACPKCDAEQHSLTLLDHRVDAEVVERCVKKAKMHCIYKADDGQLYTVPCQI
jgi:hypothetical protein